MMPLKTLDFQGQSFRMFRMASSEMMAETSSEKVFIPQFN
jgi:hypothetical protein